MINNMELERQLFSNKNHILTLRTEYNTHDEIVVGVRSHFMKNNTEIIIKDKNDLYHSGIVEINQEYIKLITHDKTLFFGKREFTYIGQVKAKFNSSIN